MKRIAFVGLLMACGVAGGCKAGSSSEATHNVEPDKLKVIDLEGSKSIVIDFASEGNVPITAVLVKKEDADAAIKGLDDGTFSSVDQALAAAKPMAKIENASSGKLTSSRSDSKVKFSVLIATKKAASVKVKTKSE